MYMLVSHLCNQVTYVFSQIPFHQDLLQQQNPVPKNHTHINGKKALDKPHSSTCVVTPERTLEHIAFTVWRQCRWRRPSDVSAYIRRDRRIRNIKRILYEPNNSYLWLYFLERMYTYDFGFKILTTIEMTIKDDLELSCVFVVLQCILHEVLSVDGGKLIVLFLSCRQDHKLL